MPFLFDFGRERFQERFFTGVLYEKIAIISQYCIFIHNKQNDSVTTSNQTWIKAVIKCYRRCFYFLKHGIIFNQGI